MDHLSSLIRAFRKRCCATFFRDFRSRRRQTARRHLRPTGKASPRKAGAQTPRRTVEVAQFERGGGVGGSITVGQTESEVIAILGRPLNVSFQGGLRKVYEYRDRKIVFVDGRVAEAQ